MALCAVSAAMALCAATPARAYIMDEVEFHNVAADTVRINGLLGEAAAMGRVSTGDMAGALAQKFLGAPYVAHTLEGAEERLRVNLDELDCTTFVEQMAALALTASEGRTSWRDFLSHLENVRYRSGRMEGYVSRLHYNSDWVVDNAFRGNFSDITPGIDGVRWIVRSIDFMSSHRDRYPALADSAVYAGIKNVESGYRNHRFPYLPHVILKRKSTLSQLKTGDIVCLVSSLKDLDVTHLGMIVVKEGVPHLLHASMGAGKVVLSEGSVADYIKNNRRFMGVRIIRLRDL